MSKVVGKGKLKPFWQAVGELAALRRNIPKERRALSGVRNAIRLDVLPRETNGR